MDRPDNPSPAPGISPVKAFAFALLLIVLATTGFLMASGSEPSPTSPDLSAPPATPDFSLTDQEAIARFEELDELATRAFVERDLTLVPLVATSDSPLREQAHADIRQLLRDGVLFKPFLETLSVDILRNTGVEIVIRQKVRERPRFFDEYGHELSPDRKTLLETVDWTLEVESGVWKIYDSNVVHSRVIGEG